MTAHKCCTQCGAELPTDGGRFCACAGPYAAERFDPMHIRPYVDLPHLQDAPHPPQGELPPAHDLEHFTQYSAGDAGDTGRLPAVLPQSAQVLPPAAQVARYSAGHTGRLPVPLPPEQPPVVPVVQHDEAQGLLASSDGGSRRAPERGGKRRPGKVSLAAAGVVAALGAGLLTTQMLTDDGASHDGSRLSTDDRALPVPSGGPTDDIAPPKQESGADASADPSRKASAAPRAARDDDEKGADAPANSAPPQNGSGGYGGGDWDRGRPWPQRPGEPDRPDRPNDGETLRFGDSGSEVAELQNRLKQVGMLDEDAPEDGVYSRDVMRAVAKYQAVEQVRGDQFGEYGRQTRRVLESETDG